MDAARRLTVAGIRVTSDRGPAVLVNNDDLDRARNVLSTPEPGADRSAGVSALPIEPLTEPFDAALDLPGSKSHTNRALLCAGLADGDSTLTRVLVADDTEAMMGALGRLGVGLSIDGTGGRVVAAVAGLGRSGFTAKDSVQIDVRQSGTTGRFLLPALAAGHGTFVVDGDEQLRRRPFGPQIATLKELGADMTGAGLPLTIRAHGLAGGSISVSGDVSSQFLSGLLLAAPLFVNETEIRLDTELVSRPYVELTVHTMADFGVEVDHDLDRGRFRVPAIGYRANQVELEPDASAASYLFAAAAMTSSRVRVAGLGRSTVQGDLRFVNLLRRMGARVTVGAHQTEVVGTGTLHGITADMADISDTAQTLAVVAACADSPTEVTGIGFIRHKESNRIAAPVTELRRLGVDAEATDDGFVIRPGPIGGGMVQTYDDHRMAMSFALLGLVRPGIVIADPDCVTKTFPGFFEVLDSLRHH